MMKVLITGAAGFLGRGMMTAFEGRCDLRLMDVVDFQTPHQKFIGSVADLETVRRAVEGMDGIVIAHMASRQAGSYEAPTAPYEVNVKGTANLFFAAARQGIRRVSLISSTSVVDYYHKRGDFLSRPSATGRGHLQPHEDLPGDHRPAIPLGIRHRRGGIRPAYITDMDSCRDKYGKQATSCNWQFIDRRNIGEAARLALELPDLGFEIFYVLGGPLADKHADIAYTQQRLGWKARYDFSNLPPEGSE